VRLSDEADLDRASARLPSFRGISVHREVDKVGREQEEMGD
jgi:hypothetical protein